MRTILEPYLNQQISLTATVCRYGAIRNFYSSKLQFDWQPTLLLTDINFNNLFLDHSWMKMGQTLLAFSPKPGDRIKFSATVVPYIKNSKKDYGFLHPRNPEVLYKTLKYQLERLSSPQAAIKMAIHHKDFDPIAETIFIEQYQQKHLPRQQQRSFIQVAA